MRVNVVNVLPVPRCEGVRVNVSNARSCPLVGEGVRVNVSNVGMLEEENE